MDENKMVPEGRIDALHSIKEEDLHYGGTINVEEEEQCVAVEVSEYKKLIIAEMLLGIIDRDVKWRKEAKERGELPDYVEIVEEDFVLRLLGLAYQEDEKLEQDDQGE